MMTVLQSQHVRKRASSSVLLRVRANGARWSNQQHTRWFGSPLRRSPQPLPQNRASCTAFSRASSSPGKRRAADALKRSLVYEASWTRERPAEKVRRSADRPRRGTRPVGEAAGPLLGVLRSPWLIIGLAAVVALLFLAFTVDFSRLPIPRPGPCFRRWGTWIPHCTACSSPSPLPRRGRHDTVSLTSLKVTEYKAQSGDTLGKIASRFKLNVDTIVSWNDIHDARAIATGTTLSIPNSNGLKYTVRRGDTLQGIALARGVDFNSVLD